MRASRTILTAVVALAILPTVLSQETGKQAGAIRPAPPKGKGLVVLRAARLIDGTGKAPISNAVVIVTDEKITAVGAAVDVRVPAGARIIDLGDATLLPGFVDAHTHLIGRVLGDPEIETSAVRDYESFGAILGVGNARDTLAAGFTTVRNVGASGRFDDLALRKAINDLIKTCATGGVLSEGDAVGTTQYNYDELKVMVDEATKLERKVAAHAHGTEGIKIATRAGVASIEHGSFIDEEGARLMAQRGTFLVPTMMAGEAVERAAGSGILKGQRAEKALAAAAALRNGIKIAVANKVPIALGTDAGVIAHGTNAREFVLMVEWGGMSPMESIVAGTLNGSKLLGWDKNLGSLTVGKWADIVAVSGDPLKDIHNMQKTVFVMKNGLIYKQ